MLACTPAHVNAHRAAGSTMMAVVNGGSQRHVPVDGTPWRLTMGLRRLDLDRWLEVDDRRGEELATKRELLTSARDEVFVALPGSEAACAELLGLVVEHLGRHFPGLVRRDGDELVELATGERLPATLDPLEAASLLVQEDLCVLELSEGAWRLTAACVCFPSRWSLREKLGRTLGEIHGPVPGFEAALTEPAVRFFDRLSVERPAWRCNWTLLETDELHLPSSAGRAPGRVDVAVETTYFRVERQTLRRLESSDAVVFTIHTYVTRLDELLSSRPQTAEALAATLRTVPDDVAAYKGWSGRLDALVAAIEAHRRAE